jgi:hypothetical protein
LWIPGGGVHYREMRRIVILILLICVTIAYAQRSREREGRGRYSDRGAAPPQGVEDATWENDPKFQKDVFTFVRLRYSDGWGSGRWRGGRWDTDYPDSDKNFSYRLQQLTSLKVNPEPIFLDITDERLFDYPWVYMIEPGNLLFSDEEVVTLRRYLLNGGFMMVDDFWGDREWDNFYEQIKRVFPDREPKELELDHPIFNCVFPLKSKPQIPSIHHWYRYNGTGITWERPDAETPHYKGIVDDKDRLMVVICHNTDLGDGWEREGDNIEYFREMSEPKAYPLGINIVFWAMTH